MGKKVYICDAVKAEQLPHTYGDTPLMMFFTKSNPQAQEGEDNSQLTVIVDVLLNMGVKIETVHREWKKELQLLSLVFCCEDNLSAQNATAWTQAGKAFALKVPF